MGTEMRAIDLGGVNCFLFKGTEGFVLVDTGFPFHREALERELEAAGCRTGNLKLIILTHGDGDHVGNAAYLKDKYGAKLAMHREDSAFGGGDPKRDRKAKLGLVSFLEIFAMLGFIVKIVRSGAWKAEAFEPDLFLEDGSSLRAFGADARVVGLSGHSRGSIGVLTPEGDLIAGDLFMNLVRPNFSSITVGAEATAESVAKLGELGVRRVLPSHGGPFSWERYAKYFRRRAGLKERA
jgi:hydroxyacylglutathione hydrolase